MSAITKKRNLHLSATRVQVEFRKDSVIFHLKGAQKFLASKGTLKIPIKNIEKVPAQKIKMPWFALRVGTHMPKVFIAGTFWTREGKNILPR